MDFLPGDVHVWLLPLDLAREVPGATTAMLSAAERERALRFRLAADRCRFETCRATLRALLGDALGVDPALLAFGEGPQGKPFLADPGGTGLQFNVSHSGAFGAIAIARDRAVGVDVERVRGGLDLADLASACFSGPERSRLPSVAGGLQDAFFAAWTRKEAWIKADGRGFGVPLTEFTVEPLDVGDAFEPRDLDGRPAGCWLVRTLEVAQGYHGAIAAGGVPWRLIRHEPPVLAADSPGPAADPPGTGD